MVPIQTIGASICVRYHRCDACTLSYNINELTFCIETHYHHLIFGLFPTLIFDDAEVYLSACLSK